MRRTRPHPSVKFASSDDPLDQYGISDIDTSGATEYYGFLDRDGAWCIMEVTITTVRYKVGETGYTTNWTGRALLEYGYFDAVF